MAAITEGSGGYGFSFDESLCTGPSQPSTLDFPGL
jgi:hypothetical protein